MREHKRVLLRMTITIAVPFFVVCAIMLLLTGCGDSNMRCTKETGLFKAKVIGHSEETRASSHESNTCKRTLQVTIMQWEDSGETFTECHHIGEMNQVLEFSRTDRVCVPIMRPIENNQEIN